MRPFTDILRDIRRGRVVDALTEELAEVVRAVKDTDKAGSLTLKLDIKPQGKDGEQVVLSAKISKSVPMAPLPDAIFFADIEGDLLRDDPNQREMFQPTDGLGDRVNKEVRA